MIYLSSTTGIPDKYKWSEFGIMFSAKHSIGGQRQALDAGVSWMMDNNEFVGDFDIRQWLDSLLIHLPYRTTCLGIPIRDKVGDALETLRRFSLYYRVVADLGYPIAFVTQDGITPEFAPWQHFDVLFVGGSDEHKLGTEALSMIAEAKRQDKRVHIGRVNSESRIRQFWMADSVDGTGLSIDAGNTRSQRIERYVSAIHYCRNRKSGKLGVNGQYKLMEVA